MRISFVERNKEVEMDETDFVVYQVEKRRKIEPWSREEWKRLLANPKVERTGEGVDTKIWYTKPKTRERVKDNFEQNTVSEGSRDLKDLEDDDVQNHTSFGHSSAASHSSAFLNAKKAEKTAAAEPQIEEAGVRKRKV